MPTEPRLDSEGARLPDRQHPRPGQPRVSRPLPDRGRRVGRPSDPRRDEHPDRRGALGPRRAGPAAGLGVRSDRGDHRRQHRLPDRPVLPPQPDHRDWPSGPSAGAIRRAQRGVLPPPWRQDRLLRPLAAHPARHGRLDGRSEPHGVAQVRGLQRARRRRMGGHHQLARLRRRQVGRQRRRSARYPGPRDRDAGPGLALVVSQAGPARQRRGAPAAPPMTDLARRIAVARGDEPADLVISGGRVLSVFTREWLECDVAVVDGWIAGLGTYDGRERIDATGRYVVPGFIDAHVHLESSRLLAGEFARLVLPLGTTTVVADPHEIANVLGTDGVHWLLDATEGMPLDVRFTASSCVPASKFESPRRALNEGDLEGLLRRRRVVGLAEMMNFPGVIAGDPAELAKLALAGAERADGHAPGVRGAALQAYAAAGIGSDHESTTIEEGRERLQAGMWLLIREATGARNLHALIPLARELGPDRIALCTDDRDPQHIAADGHVNALVRDAVAEGVDPADAIVMATLNAATWHGLAGLGAVAPAHRADLLVLPDLERFVPDVVLTAGRPPAEIGAVAVPGWVRHTVRVAPITLGDLKIPWDGDEAARVIGVI